MAKFIRSTPRLTPEEERIKAFWAGVKELQIKFRINLVPYIKVFNDGRQIADIDSIPIPVKDDDSDPG